MTERANPIGNYVSYALAAANRAVNLSLAARLKQHGVQIEAWRIMETLDGDQRLTMGELAEIVLINPPTLSKLVDRMVSDGFVHRHVAQNDHRKVNLLITALGQKRMIQIRQEIQDQDAQIFQQLGKEQAETLIGILRGLA